MNRNESGNIVVSSSDFNLHKINYTIAELKEDGYLITWISPSRGPDSIVYSVEQVHRLLDNNIWVKVGIRNSKNNIKKDMIDYRIPGTKLPKLGKIDYGIVNWHDQNFGNTSLIKDFVSYGVINYGGFECIKAEVPNYAHNGLLYVIKLEDIQKLEVKPSTTSNYRYIAYKDVINLPTCTVIVVSYDNDQSFFINKIRILGSNDIKCYISTASNRFVKGGYVGKYSTSIRYATPEEEYWVNMCDSLDRFIPKEEALNSFVPKSTTINEKITEEKIVTINGYSIEQIEAALNDIPWLEDDDAKELINEVSMRLAKVHEKIDQNHDDSFIEDAFEVGVASIAGKIAGDVLDEVLSTDEDDESDDW